MFQRLLTPLPQNIKVPQRSVHMSGTPMGLNEVVIVSAVRTPIGSMGGSLSSLSAIDLGAAAVKGALEKGNVPGSAIQEAYLGNVLSANVGQAPATQVIIKAGLSDTIPCTTINKVCASGMKAIMMGAQNIQLGQADVMVVGGMESMSNVPYYLEKARTGLRYGHGEITDGVLKDGLWDVYNNVHMGNCGDNCAKKYSFSREEQDQYALAAYQRAAEAYKTGAFKDELIPVSIPQRGGNPIIVSEDEEYKKLKMDKIASLKPAFNKDGSVTAFNASKLNDGASALVIMSARKAEEMGLKPLAKILGWADAAQSPVEFTTTPAKAVPIALDRANITKEQVDYWEINEAFSVVAMANMKLLGIDHSKVNVNGGAVSLGHPLGSSGSRITATLVHILKNRKAKYGCAAICNGGGGASAIVIENLD